MKNTIKCTKCGAEIEVSEALRHQIQEEVLIAVQKKHDEEMTALKKSLEDEKLKIRQEVKKEVSEEQLIELRDLKKQLEERDTKILEFREKELELRAERRKLQEEKEEMKLAVERELDKKRTEIIEQAKKEATESERLKIIEKDETIKRLQKDLEEAQKRASRGSQQMQGEVLELELERLLKSEFQADDIKEIKKGARGADVMQKVILRTGQICGSILWEAKNGKWQNGWISTLKEDQRQAKADIGVLVVEEPPEEIKSFAFKNGVWVTDRKTVVSLSWALRVNLGQIFTIKQTNKGKDEKMEVLFNYLVGPEFRHRIEAIVESFTNLREEIGKEKRAMQTKWARQEKEIERVIEHTVGMYGDLQGITGRALPNIKMLELPEGEEENDS